MKFPVSFNLWTNYSLKYQSNQEIIKVRELSPHIGPLTKVSLKLFLDIVPSSSASITDSRDAWTAEATFAKLQETKWRKRHCICFHSVHSRDVRCTLGRLFVRLGFRLFCSRLAVHYLADYLVLGSSIKQSLAASASASGTMAV